MSTPRFNGGGHHHYEPGCSGWVIRNDFRPNPKSAKRVGTYWYGPDYSLGRAFGGLGSSAAVFPTKLAAEEAYRLGGPLRSPLRAQRVSHAEAEQAS